MSGRNIDTVTVLTWAAENDHADIVRSLLTKGVDVNARDGAGRGNSALICAVGSVNVPIVRLLIKKGADVNLGNRFWTPLMAAAWSMSQTWSRGPRKTDVLVILKLLLAKGAKVNARDKAGQTAFSLAAAVGDIATLRALIRAGANIHTRSKGNGALMGAIQFHNTPNVEFLVRQGINVNAKNKEGKTPLMYAEECEADEIVQFLVQHGARK